MRYRMSVHDHMDRHGIVHYIHMCILYPNDDIHYLRVVRTSTRIDERLSMLLPVVIVMLTGLSPDDHQPILVTAVVGGVPM